MAGLEVSPAAIEGAHKWLRLVAKGKSKGLFSYNTETPATPDHDLGGLAVHAVPGQPSATTRRFRKGWPT